MSVIVIDEAAIRGWLNQRIEDGTLSIDKLVNLAARLALTDPDEVREEIADRIAEENS